MENVNLKKKTKIVCTIGPSSQDMGVLKKLIANGMNVMRLNFSHGDYEEQLGKLLKARELEKEGIYIPVMLDTKGPEIRLGNFANDKEEYQIGEIVTICKEDFLGTHDRFQILCPELFDDVKPGNYILINDGKMRLTVLENNGSEMQCRVEVNGPLSSHKGCNVPGVKLSMPFISDKDDSDIRFGCENNVDFISSADGRGNS